MNEISEHVYGVIKYRKCQYPDCKELFIGTGYSKYCFEHRKKEYRKVIDKLNKKIIIVENSNQYYRHLYTEIIMVTFNCDLCNEEFRIKIYPNIYVYPKYCEDHRNEHKRILWKKTHMTIIPPIISATIDVLDSDTFTDYDEDVEEVIEEKRGR